MSAAVAHRCNPPHVVDKLVRTSLRLVHHIARQHHSHLGIEELTAAGNVGLVIAAQRYDFRETVKFTSYAGFWIRAYIRVAIQKDSGVCTTTSARRLFWKIKSVADEVGNDADAIAERLNVNVRDVRAFAPHLLRGLVRLDRQLRDSDDTVGDRIAGNGTAPDELTAHKIDGRKVRMALYTLTKRERYIIEQRFLADPRRSLCEVGEAIGLTRERTRQIQVRALEKLREALT